MSRRPTDKDMIKWLAVFTSYDIVSILMRKHFDLDPVRHLVPFFKEVMSWIAAEIILF